jgi:hypothetical protein
MKVTIKIPQSIYDVPLYQYQEFQKTVEANKDDNDSDEFLQSKLVSIFGGVPMSDLRRIPLDKYDIAVEEIGKVLNQTTELHNIITVNGTKYGFIPNLEEITYGEYIDIDTYIRSPKDYHKLMAVLYRPIKIEASGTYDIEEYNGTDVHGEVMKHAGLGYVIGAMLFFYALAKELLVHSLGYSQEELTTTLQETEEGLESGGDGINQSTILQAVKLIDTTILQNFRFGNASLN